MISIIIPVYNVENYLPKCIDSLLNQSYKDLEIILINDGSADNSGKICDEYANIDSRVKVVHQANSGVSVARNVGMREAKGEWITFIDSDDYVNNNFSTLCENLKNLDSDLIISPLNKINNENETIDINIDNNSFHNIIRNSKLNISSCWSKFYKKEIALTTQFLPSATIAEDKEFVIKVLINSKKITIIDKPFYEYVNRENSAMNDKAARFIQKLIFSTDKIFEDIRLLNCDEKIKQDIIEEFSSNLFGIFRFYLKCLKQDKKLIKNLIKDKLYLFKYTKVKSKKITLKCMQIFGISFTAWLLNILRKMKIVE